MKQSISNLKLAERGAIISISTYLLLSAAKLATGHLLHSSSLVADGFNNVSDIIGNVALLIGIRMARQPADRDHRFGHWKIEVPDDAHLLRRPISISETCCTKQDLLFSFFKAFLKLMNIAIFILGQMANWK